MIISLAPLQGYTDYIFRKVHYDVIGGPQRYYAPYFKVEKEGFINKKYLRDILPENNSGVPVVPQILTNTADEFQIAIKQLVALNYCELNWNLGCPYPMVALRQLGSGLLPHPEAIHQVLSAINIPPNMDLSVKLRAGYQSNQEIFAVVEVLNQFKLSEVIFHPRIGKQLYKGVADQQLVQPVLHNCFHPLAYNGDICTLSQASAIMRQYPEINHIMIGRGLLYNPFLAIEILENLVLANDIKREQFKLFHQQLVTKNQEVLSGPGHLLTKMLSYWEYFSHLFIQQHKIYKQLRKCHNWNDFQLAVSQIIDEGELCGREVFGIDNE